MKRFMSFILLFIVTTIGVFHNPILVFSDDFEKTVETASLYCNDIVNIIPTKGNECWMICCLDTASHTHPVNAWIYHFQQSEIPRIKYTFFEKIYYFVRRVKIPNKVPPYYTRNIKNYSYYTLVRIIKSQT